MIGELHIHVVAEPAAGRAVKLQPRDRKSGIEFGFHGSAHARLEFAGDGAPIAIGGMALSECLNLKMEQEARRNFDAREIVGVVIDIVPMADEIAHIRQCGLGEHGHDKSGNGSRQQTAAPHALFELHGSLSKVPRPAPSSPQRERATLLLNFGQEYDRAPSLDGAASRRY